MRTVTKMLGAFPVVATILLAIIAYQVSLLRDRGQAAEVKVWREVAGTWERRWSECEDAVLDMTTYRKPRAKQ